MRLLDLFCGAGGAAMGYHRAGFEVVGVDINPQPNYPFEFHQADAMTYPLDGFDVIHASPPCQAFTQAQRLQGRVHPDLLVAIRERLEQSGLPYVIENVPGAPLRDYVQVCGQGLGLQTRRHRWFESNRMLLGVPCAHTYPYLTVYGHAAEWRKGDGSRERATVATARDVMDINWTSRDELSEAIPPSYTEWIGGMLA